MTNDTTISGAPVGNTRLQNARHWIAARGIDLLRALRVRWIEIAGFAGVLSVAVAVRIYRLGKTPNILTGDELENLQTAIRIIEGGGPGVFGFDWAGRPALGLYPLAWSVRIFGDSVADFRMYSVIIALLAIVLFYAVARETMRAPAALSAMLLLSTNLWFLNFSRTAWDNINAALFAIGACWATTRALKTQGRVSFAWWAMSGLFVTAGFYGYFSGRLIFASVTLIAIVAVATRQAPWRRTLAGLLLAGVISAALFGPMARNIYRNWDYFTSRSDTVSVFNTIRADGSKANGWGVAKDNILPNYRGLILHYPTEGQRGPTWMRYHPNLRPALDIIALHLFWAGLVIAVFRWRQTFAWFTFLVPLFVPQIFSGDTPDLGRAIIFAPFYFLFIGITFDEILRRLTVPVLRGAALLSIGAVVAFVSVREVDGYFDWQGQDAIQNVRMPGIHYCEYNLWRSGSLEAARTGGSADLQEFDRQRRELNCSRVVKKALGPARPPAAPPAPPAKTAEERDEQRREDLENIREALFLYHAENDAFPNSNALVQTLCVYPVDAGCQIAPHLDGPIPLDPRGGYWYQSDGVTFAVYAQLEQGRRMCEKIPDGFLDIAEKIYCVTGSAPQDTPVPPTPESGR